MPTDDRSHLVESLGPVEMMQPHEALTIIGTIWGIGGMLLTAFFIVMERQRKRAERGQMRAVLTMMGL